MSHRIARIFALTTVSAAFAIDGLGATAASADRDHPEDGPHHSGHHCKNLKGKAKRNCQAHHHGGHHHSGNDGPNHS